MWLYDNFENSFACWENFENHHPEKLQKSQKFGWKIFVVKFRYSQTTFLRFTVTLFYSNLDEKVTSNEQKVTSNKQRAKSSASRKVNGYVKLKSKYWKKGLVSCKSMQKLIWPNRTAILKCFEKTVLNFLGKHAWRRPLLPRCTAFSLERY